MKTYTLTLVLLPALLHAGCASDTPRVDAALGHAVGWVAEHQTFDPLAGTTGAHPVTAADGVRLKNALDVQRKDVAPGATQVARSVEFDSGRH